jgi:glycosyltransferase involved in cell wall biosynthesis
MAASATLPRHLLHVFPTFAVGGVESRITRVINVVQRKFRHTIVAIDGNIGAADKLDSNVDVAFERVQWRKSTLPSGSNLKAARNTLRRLQPDLMLTYNWGAIEWALADRLPTICPHIHFESGFGSDESPQRQHWRRIIGRRALLSGCKRIVVPSATLCDIAVRIWRISADRVLYIPNGVDCSRFATAANESTMAALGIPDDVPVVGTVAVLRPEKNLKRLIRAFAALPHELDARLVIVGDGPEQSALKSATSALGVSSRVAFAGHMPDPSQVLGKFDLFVLSSDTEQMPNSVLEAMAAGLAVAATDVGDVKRMLSPENACYVVSPDNEAALTTAIHCLLKDRELAGRIGRANRERVRAEFGLEVMARRYEKLYAED